MTITKDTFKQGEIVWLDDMDAQNFNAIHNRNGLFLLKKTDGSYEFYEEEY